MRRADEISMARLLTLLFEITALFDMRTRTELVMLQKTMVTVEGVARSLDPQLDMWGTAEPVARVWVERNLGPVGLLEGAGREVRTLAEFVANLPDTARSAQRLFARFEDATRDTSQLRKLLRLETERSIWTTLALWVIAVALVVLAWR